MPPLYPTTSPSNKEGRNLNKGHYWEKTAVKIITGLTSFLDDHKILFSEWPIALNLCNCDSDDII